MGCAEAPMADETVFGGVVGVSATTDAEATRGWFRCGLKWNAVP
jgi:hypothetical protein